MRLIYAYGRKDPVDGKPSWSDYHYSNRGMYTD